MAERQLLMEGILEDPSAGAEGCIMYPEVAYVRQPVYEDIEEGAKKKTGERVFFFEGKPAMLSESIDDKLSTIVENYDDLDLVEKTLPDGGKAKLPKNGTIFVEGPYQRSDVKNANKRVYPRKIWERLVGDKNSAAQKAVKERRMIGHLEHPKDGRTDGKEGALLNISLKLREDGVVWGKSELLDTPAGRILQEYTRKNVKWGVSSRGNGTVDADGKVNEDDFQLVTFDAVMNPSTPGAFPSAKKVNSSTTSESTDDSLEESEDVSAFLSEAEELRDVVVQELNESERLELARKLIAQLGEVNSLEKSKALTTEKGTDIRDWLTRKLNEAMQETEPDFDAALDEALSEDDDTHKDASGVIASLQERLADVLEEAEEERDNASSLSEQLEEVRQELEEERQLRSEAESSRDEAVKRAELAESLLAEQSAQDYTNGIEEAIDAAIEELPQLDKYRDVLEKADSIEEVHDLAERFIGDIAEDMRGRAASAASLPRPTLPSGMLVESEGDVATPSKGRNPSKGASLAGRVVSATAKK